MRVQLLACLANPNFALEVGEILEVSNEEGARLVGAGVAIELDSPAPAVRVEKPEVQMRGKREKR
jgi:hypothetical protein